MHRNISRVNAVVLGAMAVALFVATAYGQGPSILGAPREANNII
jgi:hypothetical protein